MNLQDLLKEIAAGVDADPATVRLDPLGRCTITLNDDVQVTAETGPDEETALLSAELCRYPDGEVRHQLFDVLMEAHAYGLATDDAYFGASQGLGAVFLFKCIPLRDITPDEFGRKLISFVGVFSFWKGLKDRGELSPDLTAGTGPAALSPGLYV
jgi:hypothetical protein